MAGPEFANITYMSQSLRPKALPPSSERLAIRLGWFDQRKRPRVEKEDLHAGTPSGFSGLARDSIFANIASATSLGLALPICLDGWPSPAGQGRLQSDASTRCHLATIHTRERVNLLCSLKGARLSGLY